MTRREFLIPWLSISPQPSLGLEVLERFPSSQAAYILLLHHAEATQRTAFIQWLRENDGRHVVIRRQNLQALPGHLFRMKMCFGRGLLILEDAVDVRVKEVLFSVS